MVSIKRRVIQIANSTQLISLPRKWTQKFNVKKGDELEIEEQGNKLFVATEIKTPKLSEIEVKIDGLDKDTLIFLLRGLYIRGYDQIKFTFTKPHIYYHRLNKEVTISSVIHKEIGICQGLDIIQERGDFIIMKNISVSSTKEFNTLIRRIFLLLIDMSNDLYIATKNRDNTLLETFQDKHDTITRLINYNLKTLNVIGHSEHKNTIAYFNILSSLDIVTDILKNAARDIIKSKIKVGNKALNILNKITESIKLHYDFFFNFSFDRAEKFIDNRNDILDIINSSMNELSKNDIKIVVMAEHVLEILRDSYPSRIAIQY